MMLVSLISYIDRNTLALLAPTILKETGLSAEQYGYIISAFSFSYMAGNPLWGRALDRVGLRRGMTWAVSIWTVASTAHALARGFWSFGVARAVLGFGEGATFPGGLRTVMQTLPPASRSRGVALAYSGGSLGAVITPILVTPIASNYGWRGAFWFTGLVGLAWLVIWLWISRRDEIGKTAASSGRIESGERIRIGDSRLWSYMAIYAMGGLPLAFVLYGASLYLSRVLHKTQAEIGAVLWIPPVGWELGYFFWGWVTDRFAMHGQSIGRMRLLFAGLAVLSVPLALTTGVHSHIPALLVMAFSMFIGGGFVVAAMAYATAFFPARNAGLIAGFGAGSWSALVALTMPVFGRLFDLGRYDVAFALATAFPVAGTAVWQAMNRRG